MAMAEHWFWLLLTIACLSWYSLITVYVAIRGFSDVRAMLSRLSAEQETLTTRR
jgi:hypothetical protein